MSSPEAYLPHRSARPFVSAVIPCYNEEESLPVLYERLTKVLSASTDRYEIVFANDGSRDRTLEIIREISARDARVRGVSLSRNFGHQACLTAGLDHARGEVVLMMDADLQDPPELLPKMIEKWRRGVDVVFAVRKKRKGESWFKLVTAAGFYRLLRNMTNVDIPVDTGDFRLIDRKALDAVLALRESNRFLRGMFSWIGFRQEPVYYVRQARFAGETKYPLKKMLRFAFDGITSFSSVPLRFATWLGLAVAAVAFIYSLFVLRSALLGGAVPGWASTTLSVLFLGGVQLVTIGMLGEYIGRIFDEVKRRPLYMVKEVVEHPAAAPSAAPQTPKDGARTP